MADERLNRRAFVARGATAGAALYLAACGSSTNSGTTTQLRKARVGKSGGTATLADLRDAVRGRVITAGSRGYRQAAEVYNLRFDGARPLAIVQPRDAGDVSAAVRWADRRDVRVLAKSGGHSYAGYSTGNGVVLVDLSSLASVRVDRGAGTTEIEGGAQLIDVYTKLAAHGLTVPAGSCPSVGVGGHFLGGGFGLAGRRLGLASDNVKALEIVTADGRRRTVDEHRDEDLFWACRGGGGGNFGVVTRFTLKAHRVSHASYFHVTFPWSQASAAMDAWQRLTPEITPDLTSVFEVSTGASSPVVGTSGQFFGPESKLASLLAPLTAVPGASLTTGTLGYGQLMLRWAGCATLSEAQCHTVGAAPGGTFPRQQFLAKSDYVSRRLNAAGRRALTESIESRQGSGSSAIIFDCYGGRINKPAPASTAFVHRDELFSLQYLAYFPDGGAHDAERWAQRTWRSMRPHVSGAAYQNYIDPRLDGWEKAYYGKNYARLRHVKKRYDPDFRFRFAQAIRPA